LLLPWCKPFVESKEGYTGYETVERRASNPIGCKRRASLLLYGDLVVQVFGRAHAPAIVFIKMNWSNVFHPTNVLRVVQFVDEGRSSTHRRVRPVGPAKALHSVNQHYCRQGLCKR